MINKYGIYVFECKSIGGFIYDNANSSEFTVKYRNNSKYSIYNPIMQNKYHIKYLNDTLNNQYLNSKEILSDDDINNIYEKLKIYMNLPRKVKEKHVQDIKKYKGNQL